MGGGGTAKDLEKIKLLISLIFFAWDAYKSYPLFEICVILFTEMENGVTDLENWHILKSGYSFCLLF